MTAPRTSGAAGPPPPAATAVRVLLCDDQADIRAALRDAIGNLPGFRVSAEAATGEACLDVLRAEQADLTVLDVSMPGGGAELAAALRRDYPTMTIVVFSADSAPHTQQAMHHAGVDEYIVKTGRLAPLRAALLKYGPSET